jgi:predicted nuclease of predicted toxin-antitoxin system
MNILLDECVPWPMHRILSGHTCTTATKRGWGAENNGNLIRLADAEFDLFITSDQNIRYQQNLSGRRIAIMELSPNDLRRILTAAPDIIQTLEAIQSGDYLRMEIP